MISVELVDTAFAARVITDEANVITDGANVITDGANVITDGANVSPMEQT